MKVLAIRGKNLASLAGEFDIDLQHGPLGRAGLFAITGRTGSGKSTLLDAMCLSLFGRTPRLSERTRVKLGGEGPDADLSAQDTRLLLRRGTGEGYAETDFIGKTGRWRARWTVRRAYEDPSKPLQPVEMRLTNLHTRQNIGDTKTDVLAHIEAELGLSFDQFTRSVLLAQGDFAAFLKASGRDRASLLEKMTGTELYAQLSSRCHEIKREEQLKLETLRESSRDIRLLTEAQRTALEESEATAERLRKELSAELKAASTRASWLEQRRRTRGELTEAQSALAKLAATLDADRARAAEVEGLLAVLPLDLRAEQAATKVAERTQALARTETEHTTAAKALADARTALASSEAAETEAKAQREAAKPTLEAARKLDQSLAAAKQAASAREAELAERTRALADIEARAGSLQTRMREQSEALKAHAAWAEDAPEAALADAWSTHQRTLTRLAETGAAHSDLATAHAEAERDLHAATAAKRAQETAVETAATAVETANQALEALPSDLDATLDAARVARDHARDAVRLLAERDRATQRRDEARRAHAAHRKALDGLEDEIARLTKARPALEARSQEARRTLDKTRAAHELTAHRHLLVDGEPCPLCGATEHPGVAEDPLEQLLREARSRADTLAESLRDADTRAAAAEASRATRTTQLVDLQARIDAESTHIGELDDQLVPHTEALDGTPTAADKAALEANCERLEAQATSAKKLRDERDAAIQAQATALAELTRRRDAAREARERVAELERARAGHIDQLAEARHTLPQPFVDGVEWPTPKTLQTWATTWLASGQEAARRVRAHEAALEALAETSRAREALAAERRTAHAEVERATKAMAAARQEVETLSAQRREVLDQEDTDTAARALDEAVERASRAVRQAADARDAAKEAAHATALAKTAAEAAREAAVRERDERLTEASEAATQRGLDDDARRTAGELGLDALREEQSAHQQRLEHRQRLEGQVRTLEEQLARLEEDAPPGEVDDLAAARARVAELEAQVETTTQAWSDHAARLKADDEARREHVEVEARLETQTATARRWMKLHELIGSADGNKLRKFAQSLTLDALLSHANAHLSELSPRYALCRVPGEDLELQVIDRDMGDDVRPVNSLSGGESFLTSLALALGLSSLAARDVRIDSLFIDEGFGTLDHQTLQLVLDTLDTLQATGRQVGVISHVTGIAERVGFRIEIKARGQGRSTVAVRGVN